ncbi:MAG: nuclear transport factor 2 family protein [Caldilineaceae bacterium]
MVRKFCLLSLLVLLVVVASACQPVHPVPAPRSASDIAEQLMGVRQSVVIDGVGPSKAKDAAQAQAENEFLAAAIAKEQTFYAGDAQRVMAYYADNTLSVQPGLPEMDKAALTQATVPYLNDTQIVGKLTIKRIWVNGDQATRQAEWEEVTEPKAGGPAEHHIGRCTLNWAKIDGQWKVISEYINYLEPPTPVQ